ncbi:Cys-tRNA(Pro) deacylase [Oceanobacillus bengalensis]|uniref:Cys-tRNA(Pro)/Cys-tRNA(Cys) deacylase n=1 Tax=Oceanobacillus bengalensis TaxID=1435466 RepID=A0A494YXN7_9BACI|nr:Cys-tRNA(Pro) deacylase [Oceanobacillus bengalensis]RKQ14927.1 Cys-tRNA(Pro) deacylase [Oceanobacillus bengalensis]
MKKKKVQKTNAIRLLDKENIPYNIHEYPWSEDHLDAKTAAEKVGMPLEKIYKTLVTVGDKTGTMVACIPASDELDLKALAKVSGNKKIEMLAMKDLEKTTGYIRGGCSPLGMKKQFLTFVDSQAEIMDTIVISAGKRGMQVELKPSDLKKLTRSEFVAILEN